MVVFFKVQTLAADICDYVQALNKNMENRNILSTEKNAI